MSVSAPTNAQAQNQDDLAAVVAGGKYFTDRLKMLQDAKADHDAALDKLRIGHDVIRAMQDVQVREQAAIDALKDAQTQAAQIVGAANDQAGQIVADAQARATEIINSTQEKAAALAARVDEGHEAFNKWHKETTEKVSALHDAANGVKWEADEQLRIANATKADASAAMEAAQVRLGEAAIKDESSNELLADIDAAIARHRKRSPK